MAAKLGGRFIIKEVYPYSFQEFLFAKGIDAGDMEMVVKKVGKRPIMALSQMSKIKLV